VLYLYRYRYQNEFLSQITFKYVLLFPFLSTNSTIYVITQFHLPPQKQSSTDFATRVLFGYCPQARWGKNSFMELSMPIKTIEFEQNYNKQRQPNYHLRVLKHQLSVNAQVLHSCFLKNHSSSSHPNHNRDLLGQQRSQVVSLSSKHSMRWFRCRRFFSFLLC